MKIQIGYSKHENNENSDKQSDNIQNQSLTHSTIRLFNKIEAIGKKGKIKKSSKKNATKEISFEQYNKIK